MTFAEFKRSTNESNPPAGVGTLLQALWQDANGNWEAAHTLAQDVHSKDGAWIHAYLHRKEGDTSNAAYWYRRADRPVCSSSMSEEWEEIASALLG
jgi:hypothetical protein